MVYNIADLTLDEVITCLITGDALQNSRGNEFSLSLADSRAVLAFYNEDRRTYWNPDKDTAVQDGEVDRLLGALDKRSRRSTRGNRRPYRNGNSSKSWRTASVACTDTAPRADQIRSYSSSIYPPVLHSSEVSTAQAKPHSSVRFAGASPGWAIVRRGYLLPCTI